MGAIMGGSTEVVESSSRKRKHIAVDKSSEEAEMEVDLNAPEPPSKKALRKAKKQKTGKVLAVQSVPDETAVQPEDPETTTSTPKPKSEHGVWIGNLPFTATKEDVRTFLTKHGAIESSQVTRIHLPEGRPPRPPMKSVKAQNKGFAYVDLSTAQAFQEALGLSEKLLSGRRVLIKDAKNFEGRPEKPNEANNPQGTPSQKIFVGNLGFDTTVEELKEHFSRCGAVAHVHAATFEDSGKSKGYAWVEFEDVEAATAAARGWVNVLEDSQATDSDEAASKPDSKKKTRRIWVNKLKGRQLRMEFAEDKATRYKKRFGKEAKKESSMQDGADEPADEGEPVNAPKARADTKRPPLQHLDRGAKTSKRAKNSGYERSTVQKLTGSIVQAEGKKITFD